MEFNEKTKLRSRDRLIDREQADSSRVGFEEVEESSKKKERTQGPGQQCGDCEGRGWVKV